MKKSLEPQSFSLQVDDAIVPWSKMLAHLDHQACWSLKNVVPNGCLFILKRTNRIVEGVDCAPNTFQIPGSSKLLPAASQVHSP